MNNLARMALVQPDFVTVMGQEALLLLVEDRALCDAIARHHAGQTGKSPVDPLQYRRAGASTALGLIALAHRQGNGAQVWVDETRQLL